jgi:hypothetical protein
MGWSYTSASPSVPAQARHGVTFVCAIYPAYHILLLDILITDEQSRNPVLCSFIRPSPLYNFAKYSAEHCVLNNGHTLSSIGLYDFHSG